MLAHYDRLSPLDASFLALESRATHMHVGAVTVFDLASLRTASGGVDFDRLRRHIAARLHLIPRYRQRLAWVPVEQYPVWVDDDHFNLDYHVRHIALPHPGGDEQLKQLAGRIMSQQLDRDKPLWEITIVEGLEGDRFALVSKTHHCMIDGIAGVDLMALLLSPTPEDEPQEAPAWQPRPAPNGTELFVKETSRRVSRLLSHLLHVTELPRDLGGLVGDVAHRVKAVGASLASGWLTPSAETPLNGPIGPNRRFDWLETPLETVKEVKDVLGGTVNDVVLAVVAGGVRRFLLERDVSPGELAAMEFRVMAPVSIRTGAAAGTMGNQVAMWLVPMPLGEADPVRRLEIVRAETDERKATDQALGAATLVRMSAGAPTTLVALGARLAANARPFNLTVTNVPGPQFPLYLLGARLRATYPLVPLWRGHGLGVALFSYDGTLFWGFNADYDLVPDVDRFAAAVDASLAELTAAAGAAAARRRVDDADGDRGGTTGQSKNVRATS
ncbi:MAG TPA: wax ester/triacylglycerol synthase family O-acyltransferase [Actinobacteria bacterium]|nr:wax ester/triacylglycerol synthase family O-acyltransferase [Actinomycetota bacterium]